MPLLPHSSDTESIVGVQFGVFSPEEVVRRSVCEITSASTQDGKLGGLFDPRMGVLENGKVCRSCGQNNHNCPGHFGHYTLARPVYYTQFFKLVMKMLRCVCFKCGKLLIDKERNAHLLKLKGESRWKMVYEACSGTARCGEDIEDGCGSRQPSKYTEEPVHRIFALWKNLQLPEGVAAPEGATTDAEGVISLNMPLEPEYVHRLLRRVTDEDVEFMGFSRHWCRPDWLMCSVLPIPPPQVRPSVTQDNNQRSEDDLTSKLIDIIKANGALRKKISEDPKKRYIDEWTNLLQYHVATLVDNNIPGVSPAAQRSGRVLKSLQQRLGSKEGRIRSNLQGKRVEFSARSVITPDPNISVKELGIPLKIATNLTYPEKVTAFNKGKLYALIQNGPDKFPGAKTIQRADGRTISLKHVNGKTLELFDGDTVHRHLMDGDIVLFNRQPSLHRMSMMAHVAKILPYNTFRLNVFVTAPYNADFDGDEMNLHLPQSVEAATELRMIAAVPHQIVSPRDSVPIVSVVQDTLVGANRFTRDHVMFNQKEAMNLLVHAKSWNGVMPEPVVTEPQPMWSGKQLLSALLPPVSLAMKNSSEQPVEIYNGQIIKGILDKSVFSKQLLHIIYNDYGSDVTIDFLDSLQAMIANFLMNSGFSVGISDLIADSATNAEIQEALNKLTKTIEDQILQLHTGLFENTSGRSNQEEFENKVMATLNKAVGEAGKIGLKSLADTNRMTNMIKAGSKGSDVNVSQMVATLGQTAIEGKRVPNGFQHRTLPHFKRFDDSAQARGFITSSYIKGLQPDEFFFHAMSGREGLIDTAVKTADTGYMQRQIRVALEDLITHHDGSVRDATGNVVQLSYGEDGLNATKLEVQPLPLATLSDDDIRAQFAADGAADAEQYLKDVFADRDMMVKQIYNYKPQRNVKYAVHLDRLLHAIRTQCDLKENEGTVTATEALTAIQTILKRTHAKNRVWAALLRFHLAPLNLKALGYTSVALASLVEQIIVKHLKAWVEPGQPVGVIAAQSIGEPATQMSAVYSTKIVIHNKNTSYNGSIGAYIDKLLEAQKDKVVTIGTNSVVLDLEGGDAIVGVSTDEKTSWLPIQQVSRHPANGGLVEVLTRTGRSTTATLTHSFLTRAAHGIVPTLGSALKVGDRVPVAKTIPTVSSPVSEVGKYALTRRFGWVCGMYLADGCLQGAKVSISKVNPYVETTLRAFAKELGVEFSVVHKRGEYGPSKDNNIHSKDLRDFMDAHFSHGSFDKKLPAFAFHAPKDFIAGLIGGYLDGDGDVSVERQHIRVSSRCESLLRDINRLLGYLGLYGYLGKETSIRMPDAVQYTLNIPKALIKVFADEIGFELPEKATALAQIVDYRKRNDNPERAQDMLDKIPALGEIIAETGRLLKMPGQSRTYGRWAKKESIGRETLRTYVGRFTESAKSVTDTTVKTQVKTNLALLDSAVNADVLWDEIVELVYHEDPHTYVYDFTVSGNDSFMVDDNILVHNTLNTFHLAGVAAKSNMTRGVPRLKELMKVTKNPKAVELTIPLRPDLKMKKEEARRVSQDLEFTLLQDLVTTARIYYDPRDSASLIAEDRDWLAYLGAYESVMRNPAGAQQAQAQDALGAAAQNPAQQQLAAPPISPWILRFELDRERMFAKNITMDDIAFVLRAKFGGEMTTLYTDYNAPRLVCRCRLDVGEKQASADELDDLNRLKLLQNRVLGTISIRGIPGLRAVNYQKVSDIVEYKDGKYTPVDQFVLISDGSNFLEVITHPDVDPTRVFSNNVHDMYANYGIEAARATLLREITTLFAESGSSVNYRHVSVLIDKMCHKGALMSVDRYGINKNDIGPLAKMSFEQTEDISLRAALFGERDPVLGVSAKVMLGAPIRAGTAFSEILYDEVVAVKLAESTPEQTVREVRNVFKAADIDNLYEVTEDDMCANAVQELTAQHFLPSQQQHADGMGPVEEETIEDVEISMVE